MKRRFLSACAAALLLLPSCGDKTQPGEIRGRRVDGIVLLQVGYGPDEMHRISLMRDAESAFTGEGGGVGSIDPAVFGKLCETLDAAGFPDLQRPSEVYHIDELECSIQVTYEGKEGSENAVAYRDEETKAFRTARTAVERAAATVAWR